jgi:hypothetical protein
MPWLLEEPGLSFCPEAIPYRCFPSGIWPGLTLEKG